MIVDWSLEECTFEIRRVGLPKMFGLDLLNLPRQRAGLKQNKKGKFNWPNGRVANRPK